VFIFSSITPEKEGDLQTTLFFKELFKQEFYALTAQKLKW
jgi:hypothetical protein